MITLAQSKSKVNERQAESLSRAISGRSLSNYPAIITGFMDRGIPEDQIRPRENVFTYNAWKALGRQVRKGEHGVKVLTFVDMDKTEKDSETGKTEVKHFSRPRSTTVFHITQTDKTGDGLDEAVIATVDDDKSCQALLADIRKGE